MAACPARYGNEWNGISCYKMISPASWSSAVTTCSSDGGWLVTIETSTEDTFIKSTFSATEKFWIGLTDAAFEGTWKWVQTGNTATYLNWGGSKQEKLKKSPPDQLL
jgi:hypothetical protein